MLTLPFEEVTCIPFVSVSVQPPTLTFTVNDFIRLPDTLTTVLVRSNVEFAIENDMRVGFKAFWLA